MRTVALISGGKDSCYNMLQCVAEGHEIVALANLKPKHKDELDSYMYQSVGHHAIELYAEAMGLPLYRRTIEGASVATGRDYQRTEEDEVEDLYKLLAEIKETIDYEAVSVGAVLSDYQRVRVENVCSRLGLTSLAYLWRRDQKDLLDEMIQCNVKAILIKVATLGLIPGKHLGKTLTEMREHLHAMHEKYSLNVCGEGGEYETFTLDCPLFKKEIVIDEMETVIHSDDAFAPVGYLNIKKAHLKDKCVDPTRGQWDCVKDLPMTTSSGLMKGLFSGGEGTRCLQCEKLQIDTSADVAAAESRSWTKRVLGDHIWLSGITVMYKKDVPIETLVTETMTELQNCLVSAGFDMSCLSLVHLYVQKMEDFAAINSVYKQYFGLNPAARVCVQACLPGNVALEMDCYCYRNHDNRKTMHVQGLSHWAPANIGPYSQAVMINNQVFVAGQIGMIPANLSLVGGGVHPQSRLSLQHVDRVLAAISPGCCVDNVISCVCYVTHPDYVAIAKEEWSRSCQSPWCRVVYVVVPCLPKSALVEWQVVASHVTGASYKELTRSDTENDIEVKMSCVCCDSKFVSATVIARSRASLQNPPIITDVVQLFFQCYKSVLSEAGIDWSDLSLMRLFYPGSTFKFDDVHQAFSSEAADLPVSVVPVYQLEEKHMVLVACQ